MGRDFFQTHAPQLRLGIFLSMLAVMATWERWRPRRALTASKPRRWAHNLALVTFNTLLVRLTFPLAAVGLASLAVERGWGLFNQWGGPDWLELVLALLALDLVIWAQHLLFHAVPVLWRVHQVHHSDPDYDFTTGVRFHPVEILLSMLIKFVAIVVLGPSPMAVVAFEIVLNGMALFNHGNVRLPAAVDRVVRLALVTPDMHRVHHSVEVDETNSNFGFNLAWWDRLFGTYRAQPRGGHLAMNLGLPELPSHREPTLRSLLSMPFVQR